MVSVDLIVQLYGQLRTEAQSRFIEVRLGGRKPLKDALSLLPQPIRRHIIDEAGEIKPGLLILVNEADARTVYGYNIEVSDEDKIVVVPMIHGGSD